MEFELRPDLDSSPRLGMELLSAVAQQGLTTMVLQEGDVSIGGPDLMRAVDLMVPCSIEGGSTIKDLLKLHVEARLHGGGKPEISPNVAGRRVNGLGLTTASGDDPVVIGTVDDGECQAYAFDGMSESLPDVGVDRLGSSMDSAMVSSPVSTVQLVATVPASPLAVSVLGGVQVLEAGGGQRPGLVESDVGFTSSCSTDVAASDVQKLDASVSLAVRLLAGEQALEEGVGGATMKLPSLTVSSYLLPLSVSACDSVGVGTVREEGRVSPTVREALRPQPTDGLSMKPPSLSMKPVLERAMGETVVHGCGDAIPGIRSFATVVSPDRRADVEMSFYPPVDGGNVVVMEDTDGQEDEWRACLIGYFLQRSMPFGFVRSSVSKLWTSLGLAEVKSLDNGFFVFRFTDPIRRDAVFERGPWFVGGKPLLLRRCERCMSLTKETLTRVPVWASFYNIPLELWNVKGLSRITSAGGRPLYLDRYTAARDRLAFTRVRIEVDARCPCHREVRVRCGDREVVVHVKFEWFPARCESCLVFGHSTTGCPLQRAAAQPMHPPTVSSSQRVGTGSAQTGVRPLWMIRGGSRVSFGRGCHLLGAVEVNRQQQRWGESTRGLMLEHTLVELVQPLRSEVGFRDLHHCPS
ncbi:hypothetical protein Dimus_029157 [Dionaea muscipula]